jgi:hypothetical protein
VNKSILFENISGNIDTTVLLQMQHQFQKEAKALTEKLR